MYEQACQHVCIMQLITQQRWGRAEAPVSVCLHTYADAASRTGRLWETESNYKALPKGKIAQGKSYTFTELTPEPTCLDSYTTTERLQGEKKRQDKWEECERGREECLSLEKPILSVPVPGCIKLLIVSLKLSSKDALGKNCCIKLPWRFFLGCSKYLPLATSVSPYALLQGP